MQSLLVESWIWYSFAIFVAACRLISRSLLFRSPLHMKVDDFIMMFGILTYTALVVCMNIVADKSSNLIPPGVDVRTFTKQEVDDRILGSKLVLVVEVMQCFTIWTLKTTLIIMYWRVTIQLPQHLAVKILAVYVGVSFVIMEILYFAVWCRPFHNYWAVPTPNHQCDAATDHLITNAVFNLSSDLIMLAIGFSMAIKSRLPWKRRIIVHAIFALGIFVIAAAVMNKYYSFSNPYGSQWTFWYIREASTAMIVANLPYTWHLIRRVFKVGAFDEDSEEKIKYHSSRSARGRRTASDPNRPRTLHGKNANGSQGSGTTSSDMESGLRNGGAFNKLHVKGGSGRTSPVMEMRVEPLKPAAKRTWRDRGLYGREDLEAMGSDIEEEEDLEVVDRRRRMSMGIIESPSQGQEAHDDLILHDVGELGQGPIPDGRTDEPPSTIASETSRVSWHSRQRSDGSGRQSPESKRFKSASGAPETVGRSNSKRSRGNTGTERPVTPRPMYASGRSKAMMPRSSMAQT